MTCPYPAGEAINNTGSRLLSRLYLLLAVAGAILPWLANWQFIQQYGAAFDVGLFIQLAQANPAALFISRDLAIAASAVTIWMVVESRRLRLRGLPWVLIISVVVAFACGACLFLHLRERRLLELDQIGAAQRDGVSSDAITP